MTLANYQPVPIPKVMSVAAMPKLALLEVFIVQTLPKTPRLADAANALHMSTRSLQRLLQQCQCSFRGVVAECRHQRAKHYLRQHALSIQQIAVELGFEEQSSFQKAFKHWQGCTPGVYRKICSQSPPSSVPKKGANGHFTGALWN